jgi:hypothetical protein
MSDIKESRNKVRFWITVPSAPMYVIFQPKNK